MMYIYHSFELEQVREILVARALEQQSTWLGTYNIAAQSRKTESYQCCVAHYNRNPQLKLFLATHAHIFC